jgi:hypothetical protein
MDEEIGSSSSFRPKSDEGERCKEREEESEKKQGRRRRRRRRRTLLAMAQASLPEELRWCLPWPEIVIPSFGI